MSILLYITGIFAIFLSILILKVAIPPINFPRTIPTIPFYVIFLPIIFKIDQTEMFELYLRKPLEKYGAVKIFFGSRWNILVSKPEYLGQIFRDENTFAKSGNQKKIPYSAIAAYTGDNIISAHGEVWKTYRGIMSNGLQFFEEAPIWDNTKKFCNVIEKRVKNNTENKISLGPLIQRLALDNICQVVLGFEFGTLDDDNTPLHEHLLRIKKQIFHPFYLTFPFLDLFPIPARKKAFSDIATFRDILVEKVRKEIMDNYKFEQTSYAASSLIRAYNNKKLNYTQLSDNIVILLVAGHENPQLLITTCLYLLAKHIDNWQPLIRKEIGMIDNSKDLNELPLLNSFIYESVRMYPPLNTIINRCTTRKCVLGENIVIPKGVYVGYNNYGATHNTSYWGFDANIFEPKRWGDDIDTITKTWRIRKNNATLSSFHGGRRACLGEKLALLEVRITIAEVLKRFQIKLSDTWEEKMTSGGPLCPSNLELEFIKK